MLEIKRCKKINCVKVDEDQIKQPFQILSDHDVDNYAK